MRICISLVCVAGAMMGCGGDTNANSKQTSFAGATLRLSIEKGSPLSEALRLRVPEWEARTGAKVQVSEDDAVRADADLAACSGSALADLPNRRPLSAEFKKRPEVAFIHVPYLHQTAFGARGEATIAMPLAVDPLLLWRRADLFADEKLKAAFEREHKKPLAPPTTWEDYARLAEFFQKSGAVKFGCVEAFGGDADGLRGFFARAAAFSEDPRSTPLDVNDAHSRLAAPEYLKAAENLMACLKHSPASGGKPVSLLQARVIFAAGEAAMILTPVPPTSHPTIKTAPGFTDKLAVSAPPGGDEIYDAKSKSWRVRQAKGEAQTLPFLSTTGHYLSLSAGTGNPEAAESLLAFLSSVNDSAYLVQGGRFGLTPIREDMLNDSSRFSGGYGLSGKLTADFFGLVRGQMRPLRFSADLRAQSASAFHKPLGEQLQKVAMGSVAAQAALKQAHDAWTAEISRRGDGFVDEYRLSLGFSPRIK